EQSIRHFGVKIKLNAVPEVLEGKRVVVVDDSIVRGTTSRKIVKMIRQAGAKEVHMRISSPPIVSPCFYGIDTPTKKELIGSSHRADEIRKYITADSKRPPRSPPSRRHTARPVAASRRALLGYDYEWRFP